MSPDLSAPVVVPSKPLSGEPELTAPGHVPTEWDVRVGCGAALSPYAAVAQGITHRPSNPTWLFRRWVCPCVFFREAQKRPALADLRQAVPGLVSSAVTAGEPST